MLIKTCTQGEQTEREREVEGRERDWGEGRERGIRGRGEREREREREGGQQAQTNFLPIRDEKMLEPLDRQKKRVRERFLTRAQKAEVGSRPPL